MFYFFVSGCGTVAICFELCWDVFGIREDCQLRYRWIASSKVCTHTHTHYWTFFHRTMRSTDIVVPDYYSVKFSAHWNVFIYGRFWRNYGTYQSWQWRRPLINLVSLNEVLNSRFFLFVFSSDNVSSVRCKHGIDCGYCHQPALFRHGSPHLHHWVLSYIVRFSYFISYMAQIRWCFFSPIWFRKNI